MIRTVGLIAGAASATVATAQCDWDPGFGVPGAVHVQPGRLPVVHAVEHTDAAFGPGVYAGGVFAEMGGAGALAIAHWHGGAWSGLASGLEIVGTARFENPPHVNDMVIFDDGRGPQLYVVGNFNTADPDGAAVPVDQVARWDGARWSEVGGGLGPVNMFGHAPQPTALAVFQGELYASGLLRKDLGSPVDYVGRYDGVAWRDVGAGDFSHSRRVASPNVLAIFDDGAGEALYAAGVFTEAPGGVSAHSIARWDGAAWSALGTGVNGEIKAMAVYDDGSGPALYVGGAFDAAGGVAAENIARWDGTSWSDVGGGVVGVEILTTLGGVFAMTVFDDGSGPALYVGGRFSEAGGQPASNLARWDGAWTPVAGTIAITSSLPHLPEVRSLAPMGESGLIVGGFFDEVGAGVPAGFIARYGCDDCYADCDESGDLDFFDFLCFQNQFAAGAPEADCDASGGLDFFDFLCFQNAFTAGCP